MIEMATVKEFLAGRRFAVVGASDDDKSFGGVVYRALRDHGYDVVPVNRSSREVAGDTCYPDLASVPGELDGVVVMVNQRAALDVVRDSAARGVHRVWLFKGAGAPGAVSDEAIQLCDELGLAAVAGACPLMFLEPVGWFHRLHRGIRRLGGSLEDAA
jgi:predicted CoA-binding protein